MPSEKARALNLLHCLRTSFDRDDVGLWADLKAAIQNLSEPNESTLRERVARHRAKADQASRLKAIATTMRALSDELVKETSD